MTAPTAPGSRGADSHPRRRAPTREPEPARAPAGPAPAGPAPNGPTAAARGSAARVGAAATTKTASPTSSSASAAPAPLRGVLALQKRAGNSAVSGLVQRQCSTCAAGKRKCAKCREEEDGATLQRAATSSAREGAASPGVPHLAREILRESGVPIPELVRRDMEARLGADFSRVRVHTGPRAARAARSVDARAYTLRDRIVFGDAEFAPHTPLGRRLLAHELVHVVQQRGDVGGSAGSPSVPEVRGIGAAGDHAEHEAEQIAAEATETTVATVGAPGAGRPADASRRGDGDAPPASPGIAAAVAPPSLQGAPPGIAQRDPEPVSVGESIARFFGGGTFSQKELDDYIQFLDDHGAIEDAIDSDNKARVIVGQWVKGRGGFNLTVPRKILLIKEMEAGVTDDDDEAAIIDILEHSENAELKEIFTAIDADDLNSEIHGSEWDQLKDFYARRFKGGLAKVLEHVVEPMGEPKRRGGMQVTDVPSPDIKGDEGASNDPSADMCNVKEPERCPTYESWLHNFTTVTTFTAQSGHQVLGDPKTPVPNPSGTDLSADPSKRRPPDVRGEGKGQTSSYMKGDRFIDGPTEKWVRDNLPPNLLRTAYELPSDCADIAVILRHVWLSAHHRSEKAGPWLLGSRTGEARADDIRQLIVMEVGPAAERFLNPYVDAKGQPLRKFTDLEPLLHAGDVLVWDHTIGSGHLHTLIDVTRDDTGRITAMVALQGNQPIGPDDAAELNKEDKEEQKKKAAKDRTSTPSVEELRAAPGRRIERSTSLHIPNPDQRADPIWSWHDRQKTFLVAAGPPSAAKRPPPSTKAGRAQPRAVTDWVPSLKAATLDTIDPVFEAMLLDLRAALEGNGSASDADATALGQAAGDTLSKLLSKSGDLQEGGSSLFRIERMRAQISAVRLTTCVVGTAESKATDKTKHRCSVTPLDALDKAFTEAARGISSVDFARKEGKGDRTLKVLMTGFDPFNLADVSQHARPGDFNPAGAAVRQLDGQTVQVQTHVQAAVEGVILPVSFAEFRAGLVESIVDAHQDADAILTVSLDPNFGPDDPVQLEQFAVGVHSGGAQVAESVPTKDAKPGTPAIFEARGDTAGIAADTERAKTAAKGAIPKPTVDTAVTIVFASKADADAALKALGEAPQGTSRVVLQSVAAIRQIASTMQQEGKPGGTGFSFTAGKQKFTATLVSGPGGAFLSNEVSFRVLRRLGETGHAQTTSFHTHVPPAIDTGSATAGEIPQDTSTPAATKARTTAVTQAKGVLAKLVETLKRMVQAVGKRIIGSASTGTTTQGTQGGQGTQSPPPQKPPKTP
jgi:uncharacterized protein DUF4157